MLRVIINADDLGASLNVDKAIEDCIRTRTITSSTIIAGGEAFDDAVRIAGTYPEVSFGVHLTLDEYKSITRSETLKEYGIIDEHGAFVKNAYKYVDRYSPELKQAIVKEWNAQIAMLRSAGLSISHADSHHHCHTWPALQDVLFEVLKENGITRVRLPHVRTIDMLRRGIKRPIIQKKSIAEATQSETEAPLHVSRYALIISLIQERWRLMRFKRHFITTDFFCAASFFQAHKNYMLTHFEDKTIELMCHPGHPDYEDESSMLPTLTMQTSKLNYREL